VKPCRALIAVPTLAVALVLAVLLPVAQLRTYSSQRTCCCPDPTTCHCFDHKIQHPGPPALRPCHTTSRDTVTPEAPALVLADATLPVPVAGAADVAAPAWRSDPHTAPDPRRPAAPS
jgi:hypothetical protein